MLTTENFLPTTLRVWADADVKGWTENPDRLRHILRLAARLLEKGHPPSPYQQGYDEAMSACNAAGFVGMTPAEVINLMVMLGCDA